MTTNVKVEKAASSARVLNSDPLFGEIAAFLTDEAALLDDDGYLEWMDKVTDDIAYDMPGRKSLHRRDGKGFEENVAYYKDNRESLNLRARHNTEPPSAWYREPPMRVHRTISNIAVHLTANNDEYEARSSIVLYANRFDQAVSDVLTAKRTDILRRTSDGLKLAKREILIDQAILAQPFSNLFL